MTLFNQLIWLLIVFSTNTALFAQDTLYFENPSFEGIPRHSQTPKGWKNCGLKGESPPDIQPNITFNVDTKAYDGNTYVSMVVRDNDTWESMGTKLSEPLQKDHFYQFEISLARAENFSSVSRNLLTPANYNTPVKLKIWGGLYGECDFVELLGETPSIEHTNWEIYRFYFQPKQKDIQFMMLEVYYDNIPLPYNGNLLLDAASSIIQVDTIVDEQLQNTALHILPLIEDSDKKLKASEALPVSGLPNTPSCYFIKQLAKGEVDQGLIGLADYEMGFNENAALPWVIAVSGVDREKYIRYLKFRIRKLKLKAHYKVVASDRFEERKASACNARIGNKIINVYR